jgi:hypothetical protein
MEMKHEEMTPAEFGVTKADFERWRLPREGVANPSRMDNAVWKWLIKTRLSGYQACEQMGAESGHGATWSFDRFGQSSTTLADGRVIHIGGEHEDYYDPDFYIYNDVVVVLPDGEIEIRGYPITVFPPTDFHSATLVDRSIYVIGNLGHTATRSNRIEVVYMLDTTSFAFSSAKTTGDLPDWLHDHKAELLKDSIRISGGKIEIPNRETLVENLNTWELSLSSMSWKLVHRQPWRRWEFRRADGKANFLWHIRSALFSKKQKWMDELQKDVERLTALIGNEPDLDSIDALYRPGVEHNYLGEEDENYGNYRVEIDGVLVRYVESHGRVQLTVEGLLSEDVISEIRNDLKQKLSKLESVDYVEYEIP